MTSFYFKGLLLLGAVACISGCKKVCDTDDLPEHTLTAGLRNWSAAYQKGATLRFQNAATGYIRSYQVVEAENKIDGVSSGYNVCPAYRREYTSHALERRDSTGSTDNKRISFGVYATPTSGYVDAKIFLGSTSFSLPLAEVEDGREALPAATFAGRLYPAVLGRIETSSPPRSGVIITMYLTKAEGLVRFEERGGAVWNRI